MSFRRACALIVATFWQVGLANAQENDETALSHYEIFTDEIEIVPLSELETLEDRYTKLLDGEGCENALPLIVKFSESSNKTANITRQGNKPLYAASREKSERVSRNRSLLNELIRAEDTFNDLIRRRNKAWVEEAKCLLELGEKQAAINRLYRALDYIDVTDSSLWSEARFLLWNEIGFPIEK